MAKSKSPRKKKKTRSKSKNKAVQEIKNTAVETVEEVSPTVENKQSSEVDAASVEQPDTVVGAVEDEAAEPDKAVTEQPEQQADISVQPDSEEVQEESNTDEETENIEEPEIEVEQEVEQEPEREPETEAELEPKPETEAEAEQEPEPVPVPAPVQPKTIAPKAVAPKVQPEQVYVTEYTAPKKKHTGIKVLTVLALLFAYSAAFITGAFTIEKNIVKPDKYPKGTIINEVDVSGKTVEEAKEAITESFNKKRTIAILDRNSTPLGEIKDFTFEYDIDDELEKVLHPGAEKAIAHYIRQDNVNYMIEMHPSDTTASFDRQFTKLPMVENSEGDKPSKNAYIDKSDTEFRIVKEVIGNSVDTDALRNAIFEAIARGEDTFEYRRESFYRPPEIISTSQVLLDEREYCRKYLSFSIRLRNSVNDYTITPEWLDKMMRVTEQGKVKVNDDKVGEFISNVLYPKFSSTGDTRKLKSAGGGTYTVSGGTYGFTIDTEKERKKITNELKARENVEREPYYSGKKPNKKGTSDIGDDFVEVSIAKQTVWVVKNGKTIVETPVVTGNVPRHNTPTGTFYIVYKATNTTLKGHNDDGSEYESHVAYWMPFYLGYGLHDASWRGYFGGSIYLGNGSHGCVNCPPSIMPKIFNACYTGMPVIVH